MIDQVFGALIVAAVTGGVSGLITWGSMRVEVRYLRRDIDRAHLRIDELPCQAGGRRSYDVCHHHQGGKPL